MQTENESPAGTPPATEIKVSVIVPIYNVEKYLAEAVDSLRRQSVGISNIKLVLVDDGYGVGLAVEHLVKRGCRDLYYLKDLDTASAQLKCKGFLEAAEHAGLKGGKRHVIETDFSVAGGMKAVDRLIREGKKFDGIVCGEDITAAGAVKALLRAGLKVPEDVAVTGYNNSEYSRICEPPLTTVDNKPELVAMLSVQLLTSLIEETDAYSSCTIQPEIVQGRTT